jgi:DNA-binding transcriptional ArsR family regulator
VVDGPPLDDDARKALDQRLANAIGHPLRVALLEALHGRVSSPSQLAPDLEVSLSLVYYHVKVLEEAGAISLVKTESRKGATEYFYTAQPRCMIGHQDWRRAPLAVLPAVTSEVVRTFADQLGRAIDAGTIDGREDTVLSWMPITVDRQGWEEVMKLLRRAAELLTAIHDRSVERLGGEDGIPVVTGLAAFEAAPPGRDASTHDG